MKAFTYKSAQNLSTKTFADQKIPDPSSHFISTLQLSTFQLNGFHIEIQGEDQMMLEVGLISPNCLKAVWFKPAAQALSLVSAKTYLQEQMQSLYS